MSLQSSAFIVLSCIVIIFSTRLFYQAAGTLSLRKLNPISSTYYFLMGFSVIGTSLMVSGLWNHYMDRYVRHWQTYLIAWLLLMILMIVFPSLVILFNKLVKHKPESFKTYLTKPLAPLLSDQSAFVTMAIASAVCLGAVIYTFAVIGITNTPMWALFFKDLTARELAIARINATSAFPGNSLIKNIFAITLTPVISYIVFVYARKTREKKWFLLFVPLFIAATVMSFWDLQKAPILIYWGTFLYLNIYYGTHVKIKHLVIFGAISFVGIILMYFFISGSSLQKILSPDGPINRLLLTSAMGLILHLEVYTYRALPLKGASLRSVAGKLAGFEETLRSARDVMEHVNFEGVMRGTAGVYNGLFLGEAYANWQQMGVWISMVHVPLLFALMHYVFMKLEKNPFTVSLYTYLTVRFLFNLHGGYTDYVLSTDWLAVIATVLAMVIFGKILDKVTGWGQTQEA